MWLIDGSKLKATYLNGRYGFDCLEVLRAPTVNAIPVEWIRKWAGRNVAETDNCSWNTYTLKLLQDWEKENEH